MEAQQQVVPRDRQALILSAHKLVFKIAKEFKYSGPSYDDLVQEGCVGLCIAANKFDPSRGVKFITYAVYWIRAYMLACVINTHGPVKFGTTRWQRKIFFNLGKVRRQIEKSGGEATLENLARALSVSVEVLTEALPRMQDYDYALDAEFGEGMKISLRDNRPSQDVVFEEVRRSLTQNERVKEAVASLGGKLAQVIQWRFLQEKPLTLRDIGNKWGVSRERVRQVEVKALLILKKRLADQQEDKL